jgi:hypothetical protein
MPGSHSQVSVSLDKQVQSGHRSANPKLGRLGLPMPLRGRSGGRPKLRVLSKGPRTDLRPDLGMANTPGSRSSQAAPGKRRSGRRPRAQLGKAPVHPPPERVVRTVLGAAGLPGGCLVGMAGVVGCRRSVGGRG